MSMHCYIIVALLQASEATTSEYIDQFVVL